MEKEQELKKLLNVLHRMTRSSMRVQWMGAGEAEARFAVSQYNKILTRLQELDPTLKAVFDRLPDDSTLTVVAMAARQVGAYYESEYRPEHKSHEWGPPFFAAGFPKGCGVDFNLEDIGNWIRDRMSEMHKQATEQRAEEKPNG